MPTHERRALKRALVTGAAGFIGSHLCERLLEQGVEVIGIDCFNDNYDQALKRSNVEVLERHSAFRLIEMDITKAPLDEVLPDVDTIFHLAGEPGVRSSWGQSFSRYVHNNIEATQALLEAVKQVSGAKFVYASSSSIYGQAATFPTPESVTPAPLSPYGMTKLAGEHLVDLYAANYGVAAATVRYFTVFGPRQRPDMAFNIFCRAILEGRTITILGDGRQTRDFTYVQDAVDATIAAGVYDGPHQPFNVGGGSSVSLREVIDMIGEIAGVAPRLEHKAAVRGDVKDTSADTSRARRTLGWMPSVPLRDGLAREYAWAVERFGPAGLARPTGAAAVAVP